MHASKRSEFIACEAACEIPQQISFYLHVRETLLELSPLKAALPLLIASAVVTGLAPACCFAVPGAWCLMAGFPGSLSRSLARSSLVGGVARFLDRTPSHTKKRHKLKGFRPGRRSRSSRSTENKS